MKKKITAIIVMLSMLFPGVAMADDQLINVAVNQYAEASSVLSEEFAADKANDGINDNPDYTAWRSSEKDEKPYWQTDLAIAYKISKIEIEARRNGTKDERSNFRVLVSNDPEFSQYEVAGECKEDYGNNETWSMVLNTRDRYQYVRVEKTSAGELSIGEINIYVNSSSILYGTEVSEANTQNPVIDDANRYNIPADVQGTDIEKDVRFLSALSIMQGYPDGNFLPGEPITRAEFATVATRLVQLSFHNSENTFTDVPENHWAYEFVEICYDNGMINGIGDGVFAPEDYVTYEQAVKIVVCTLGYGNMANNNGGYPSGYIKIASSLGILDEVLNDGEYISRGNIAKLCYASLFARLPESEYNRNDNTNNLATKVYKLLKMRGRITEIDGLSLTKESVGSRSENYIVVNSLRMTTEDPHYRDYFGCMVEVYYCEQSNGDTEAIIIIPIGKEKVIEIDAEDVEDFSSANVLSYYNENGRLKRLNFSSTLDVIYNNQPLLSYDRNTLIPGYGTIRAIDYDDDGKYDMMIIRGIKTYVVNWVNAADKIIYQKTDSAAKSIEFSDDDVLKIYNIEGEEIELSDIATWNVLSVEASGNSSGDRIVNIYVSDVLARGVISEVGEDYVTIRNKQYQVAETLDIKNIKVGDKGVFYLDYYGRIAAFDGEKSGHGGYGFLINAYIDYGEDTMMFRVFNSYGEFETLKSAKNLKIDGAPFKEGNNAREALLLGGGTNGEIQQLIRYSTNSKSEITSIDTVYTNPQYEKEGEGLRRDFEAASRNYKSNSGVFGMVLSLADDAVIFRVPVQLTDTSKYEIVSRSTFSGGSSYAFEAYDCGKLNTAKAAVISEGAADSSLDTAYFCIIDKITTVVNHNGDIVNKFVCLYKGEEASYVERESGLADDLQLKRGDIVCISLDSNNEIKRIEKRFYDGEVPAGTPEKEYVSIYHPIGPGSRDPYWNLFMIYGTIELREDNMVKIKVDTSHVPEESVEEFENSNYGTIIANIEATNLYKYIYDSDTDKVRIANSSDFVDAETLGGDKPINVVCRINSADVLDIMLYK